MDEHPLAGVWLLMDAAGPHNLIALVKDGEWLSRARETDEFLEMLQPATADLLGETGLEMEELTGVVYASGPGSTLGLRLAAMFIRSLLEMPLLKHWKCLQYQNLELALCSSHDTGCVEAVAPWRRDRFHHLVLESRTPVKFTHQYLSPGEAEDRQITGFILGRRLPSIAQSLNWKSFPIDEIPALLKACPELLRSTSNPTPYMAEEPDFVRWASQRHSKK
jgi:tRNA A37 threonylcarbamoyladenosine modification protein TsaB